MGIAALRDFLIMSARMEWILVISIFIDLKKLQRQPTFHSNQHGLTFWGVRGMRSKEGSAEHLEENELLRKLRPRRPPPSGSTTRGE